MTITMTKKTAYNDIRTILNNLAVSGTYIEGLTSDEILDYVEFVDHEIGLLEKKNCTPHSKSKKAKENAVLKAKIVEVIADNDGISLPALVVALSDEYPDITFQRVSALASRCDEVDKTFIDKRVHYIVKSVE